MRILLVQESDWLERNVHQQHHLMERLALRGHVIRVIDFEITWRGKPVRQVVTKRQVFNHVSKAYKGPGVTVIRPGIVKLPVLDYVSLAFSHGKEIHRQIVEVKPDVIVGLGILNTVIALVMAKRHKIPFVYYLIDALHTLIPVQSLQFLGKMLESRTLKQSDTVCVINDELKRYAVELGASPNKVQVVRAGVDTERFHPGVNGLKARKQLGIGKDDLVLFFMGWLYPFSGLREVATELAQVQDEQPHLKLVVVGEGDLLHELERVKKDYGLEQLILAGRQSYEAIPAYVAASDVCLLPAHNNDVMRNIVPIKMYEYMACGKPVIATELPGIMREFGHENGVTYVGAPREVLKKAIELGNDKKGLAELGARARELVEKSSWHKITREFEAILKAEIREH